MKWLNDYRMRLVLIGFVAAVVLSGGSAKADFTFGEPTNLGPPVNSIGKEVAPSISADGLELYWHSNGEIWGTARATTTDAWGTPVNLGPLVNSSSTEYNPSISADGLELYFSSDRPGGSGSQDIYVATRITRENEWDEAVNLGSTINNATNDGGPSISADGLELYFQSLNRAGGYGDFDNWIATRTTRDEPWGVPIPLPPPLNTSYHDRHPYISDDGLALFFDSHRPSGLGDNDVWMTTRPTREDPGGAPFNIGSTFNSSFAEGNPNFWADGLELYFSSGNRPEGVGDHDIWHAPILPIVDFNGDGIVDSADMCIMVDHWGTDDSLCDIGPMPWGDGIVDVQDLIVLAEHFFVEPGLVAHWKLDETEGNTAYDSIVDNDGMVNGEPVWQPEGGMVDGALQFDGIDDYVRTDFVLNPADGAFSVFAWIKASAPGQVILSQADGVSWLCTDSVEGCLMTELTYPSRSSGPLLSQRCITDGEWHRIGLVWDGFHRRLYVDGVEVAKDDAQLSGLVSSDGGLYLGTGSLRASGTFFSGLIDDVRIYNRAVSP